MNCVEWWGATLPNGYGVAFGYRERTRAHRFVWQECFGPLPNNIILHHECRNPLCVNPLHLTPMTRAEHNREHSAEITHCPRGHEYNEENTYIRNDRKNGWTTRKCRACNREKESEKRYGKN